MATNGVGKLSTAGVDHADLADLLEVLASPVRLALLHRLSSPAFVPDLVEEIGLTRQSMEKHLHALEAAGLVAAIPSRRGALPATSYVTSGAGLFALKERMLDVGRTADPALLAPQETLPAAPYSSSPQRGRVGLLLVHGETPGRWFSLHGMATAIVGRDPTVEVPIPSDPFASSRHASLWLDRDEWCVSDLHATNPTRLNFKPIPAGQPHPIRHGDLLTVGRTHLLFRLGA